ncbi:MAG TPA: hypothetical protein VHT96_05715 [Clostridia bacterium]|nr:hypothetical protein [Clostridia bacterium]
MSDVKFGKKLDSELKNIVFTDKSRNRVLERAAGRRRAPEYGGAADHASAASGRAAEQSRAVEHSETAAFRSSADHTSADHGNAAEHNVAAALRSAAAAGRRLSGAKEWWERLHSFMNLELRIPVKPLVVALFITVSGIVYACFGVTRVSAEDIRRSSITVVNSNQGGQADGIYKNKG